MNVDEFCYERRLSNRHFQVGPGFHQRKSTLLEDADGVGLEGALG